MTNWIEVKARYDKKLENGAVKAVTEAYLVDALSCTEAEARTLEELKTFISGGATVISATRTKIREAFLNDVGDRYYKVKVNFITIDEKTAAEKLTPSCILVQADDFDQARQLFADGMKGTMADYEIEAIAEAKYVEVYRHKGA